MAAWPGTLPTIFQVQGFKEDGADNLIRSSMDVGPAKVRRRTTTNVRNHAGSMWLTDTQYSALRTFFETTVSYGSQSFTMDDVHGTNRDFRFVKPPEYSSIGPGYWEVKLSLEELP